MVSGKKKTIANNILDICYLLLWGQSDGQKAAFHKSWQVAIGIFFTTISPFS